jgi:hypothetical protein
MATVNRLAGLVAAAVLVAGCSGSVASATAAPDPLETAATAPATPTATPTATAALTASASVVVDSTASPPESPAATASATVAPTKATAPPATARITTAPTATPGLPNITGGMPALTPATPTCKVNFVIDVEVTNEGLGPMPGEALMAVGATRTTDSWIGLKYVSTIPTLAAGASVHLRKTVQIARAGSFDLMAYVDSSLWFAESREDDNEVHEKIGVSMGTCPKL